MFRINDTRGSVIALDGLGRELQEPENAKRVVTFHRGPCPAFPVVEYTVVETEREGTFAGYAVQIRQSGAQSHSAGQPSKPRSQGTDDLLN